MMHVPARAFDRKPSAKERQAFFKARRAERLYVMQLRRVAAQIGHIVRAFDVNDPLGISQLIKVLESYSRTIEPWARAVATSMIADVSRRDANAWAETMQDMSAALRLEIRRAPTGLAMQQKLAEQIHYITSMPLDAAQRVHKLATEGLLHGTRPAEISKEILKQGHVSRSKADLIARTEVGRVAGALTQVRAEYIGSDGYVWRSVGDSAVRESHRKLNGKFILWSKPPTTDGLTYHAGCGPNCRCYSEPVIPN